MEKIFSDSLLLKHINDVNMPNIDIYRRFPSLDELNISSNIAKDDKRHKVWNAQRMMYNGIDNSVTWCAKSRIAKTMLPILYLFYDNCGGNKRYRREILASIFALYLIAEGEIEEDKLSSILPYDLVQAIDKDSSYSFKLQEQYIALGMKYFVKNLQGFWL